jgi:hypothetical protein
MKENFTGHTGAGGARDAPVPVLTGELGTIHDWVTWQKKFFFK